MPGLLEQLLSKFTGPPAAQDAGVEGRIAKAVQIAKQERPDLAPVEQYGMFSKLLRPDAQGYTSPARTIYLNPEKLRNLDEQGIADTLIHEQTHVDQMKRRNASAPGELMRMMFSPDRTPYGQRPDEMEAFQNEKNRRYRMDRVQTPIASFQNPDDFVYPHENIVLPYEGKK